MTPIRSLRLAQSAIYFPKHVVTAAELDARLGLPAGWVEEKTGVTRRHVIDPGRDTNATMGAAAARGALDAAGLDFADVDLLINASASIQQPIPCTAALIQRAMGEAAAASGVPCFDLNATCLSFLMALEFAAAWLAARGAGRVLLVSSEIASQGLDWSQPGAACLFGDGAAAFLLEATPEADGGLLASRFETFSEGADYCRVSAGAQAQPPWTYTAERHRDFLFAMDGPAVHRLAMKRLPGLVERCLADAGVPMADVATVVPHQAGMGPLRLVERRLGLAPGRMVMTVAEHGNLIAASIPVALHLARTRGRAGPATPCCCSARRRAIPRARCSGKCEDATPQGPRDRCHGLPRRRDLRAPAGVRRLGRDRHRARPRKGARAAAERFVPADLAAPGAAARLADGHEGIIHCAALAAPWGSRKDFERANVAATAALLDAAVAAGVRRFVHVSTPSIYAAYAHREDLTEDSPLPARPISEYACTKLAAERLVLAARDRLEVVVLRPRALVGVGDTVLLPRLARAASTGRLRRIGGSPVRTDLTCVENAALACRLALETDAARVGGETFNITNGEPMPLWEALGRFLHAAGLPTPRGRVPFAAAWTAAALAEAWAHHVTGREPVITRHGVGVLAFSHTFDIGKARRLLGYAPTVPLAEGLARAGRWWRETAP